MLAPAILVLHNPLSAEYMFLRMQKIGWVIGVLFLTPVFAFAQIKLQNPIRYSDLPTFFLDIVQVVVQYGAILVVFFLVYAGFKFVTAQGNPEKISEAKKMLAWVVVGAFVLLGVFVIREAICGTLNQLKPTGAPEFCKPAPTPGGIDPTKTVGGIK